MIEPKFKQGDVVKSFYSPYHCILITSVDTTTVYYVNLETGHKSGFLPDAIFYRRSEVLFNDPSVTPDNFADKYPEFLI